MSVDFPVQVSPWSAQRADPTEESRDRLMKSSKRKIGFFPVLDIPFCIGIVALASKPSRHKDCANLAKGILDTMQGIVYVNDFQIQCLAIRRMEYSGNVEFLLCSCRRCGALGFRPDQRLKYSF